MLALIIATLIAQDQHVNKLILRLSDDDPEFRERAEEELARLGANALHALEDAYPTSDEEARPRLERLLRRVNSIMFLIEELRDDDEPGNARRASRIIIEGLKTFPQRYLKYVLKCLESGDLQQVIYAGYCILKSGHDKELMSSRPDFYKFVTERYSRGLPSGYEHIGTVILCHFLRSETPAAIEQAFSDGLKDASARASLSLTLDLLRWFKLNIKGFEEELHAEGTMTTDVLKKYSIYFPGALISKLIGNLADDRERGNYQKCYDVLQELRDHAWPELIGAVRKHCDSKDNQMLYALAKLLYNAPDSMLPVEYYKVCSRWIGEKEFYGRILSAGRRIPSLIKDSESRSTEYENLYLALALIGLADDFPVYGIKNAAILSFQRTIN